MKINITEDNLILSDIERSYINEKFSKVDRLLVNFDEDLKDVSVKVWVPNRYQYGINFQLWLPGGEQVYAEEIKDNFQNAVNEVKDEVERQIKKRMDDYRD